ncbi:hypothetical protein PJF60_05030, partial [Streptococcus thermophilus]|nr:hypothetical protein [Streptococcus thermophilus]MDA5551377.1 hypothetical protein [Streptococcus thermophilus]
TITDLFLFVFTQLILHYHEKLVLHYANNLYDLKKNNNRHAVLEMRKCIAATKLVDSNQIAIKFENYLQKVLDDMR